MVYFVIKIAAKITVHNNPSYWRLLELDLGECLR